MIIEPIPSIEEVIRDTFASLALEEAGRISEKFRNRQKYLDKILLDITYLLLIFGVNVNLESLVRNS